MRVSVRRFRAGWLFLVLLVLSGSGRDCLAQRAVEHRGVVFVSLDSLLSSEFLGGESELTRWNRVIEIETTAGARRLEIAEGGDRVVGEDGTTVTLKSPVLVLQGRHYLPAEEMARFLDYKFERGTPLALVAGGRRLELEPRQLNTPHLGTRVSGLRPVRRAVVLGTTMSAERDLHVDTTSSVVLAAGTALFVRREVRLNDTNYVIVTRNDRTLESLLVRPEDLARAGRESSLEGTHLGAIFARLGRLAETSASINFGPRQELPRTIAVTVDLCWSLREFESGFFEFLPRMARVNGEAWATIFVTGRWLQQHPDEMERLIELGREPGVGLTWALHSWDHPKEMPFMNGYTPEEVKADALRLEHDMLEWGIVPSLFYRFPGLIHDRERLQAILELDLVSVDCDSWVTAMYSGRGPHRQPARDGSILLIHGNGNEARGIPMLYEWMIEHAGWNWGALPRFISAEDPSVETDPNPEADAADESRRQSRGRRKMTLGDDSETTEGVSEGRTERPRRRGGPRAY